MSSLKCKMRKRRWRKGFTHSLIISIAWHTVMAQSKCVRYFRIEENLFSIIVMNKRFCRTFAVHIFKHRMKVTESRVWEMERENTIQKVFRILNIHICLMFIQHRLYKYRIYRKIWMADGRWPNVINPTFPYCFVYNDETKICTECIH